MLNQLFAFWGGEGRHICGNISLYEIAPVGAAYL